MEAITALANKMSIKSNKIYWSFSWLSTIYWGMSTAGHALQKESTEAVSTPRVGGWLRRTYNRFLDATGLRAPLGYEDADGFHYGSLPLAEQDRIARRNMKRGEDPTAVNLTVKPE
jgi:hypothetical protein